jgi:hypothetical protein
LVNNKHNTSWSEAQVKAKITYTKSKYREAAALNNSTGEGPGLLHKQEVICPMFVRLHTVLGGSLSVNPPPPPPPPPRQTGGRGEDLVTSDDSEEDTSDVEIPTNATDTGSQAGMIICHARLTWLLWNEHLAYLFNLAFYFRYECWESL